MDPHLDRRTRLLMYVSFGTIAALMIVVHVIAARRADIARDATARIQTDALAGIQLVDRMRADVEARDLLVELHIVETVPSKMAQLERRIATLEADFTAAARAYVPLATTPGETVALRRFTDDVAIAGARMAPVLALSRQGKNDQARRTMMTLAPELETITKDANALVAINEQDASRSVAQVGRILDEARSVRLMSDLMILLVTLAMGLGLTRAVVRAQRALLAEQGKLERRCYELDAFSGRVAHDLRGPLATLTLSASVLEERSPQAAPTTARMRRAVAAMAQMIEDLLELSRVAAMPRGATPTEPVAAALERELGALVRETGGALRVDLEPAQVCCAEGLLRQALWNLGHNAVKYRARDVAPAIEIVGRARRQVYEVRVSDNGVGMTADDASHVFEPFFRAAATRDAPGTGLGLAIVRRIAEVSGGAVWVERTQPGCGTTFVFTVPVARAPQASAPTGEHAIAPV